FPCRPAPRVSVDSADAWRAAAYRPVSGRQKPAGFRPATRRWLWTWLWTDLRLHSDPDPRRVVLRSALLSGARARTAKARRQTPPAPRQTPPIASQVAAAERLGCFQPTPVPASRRRHPANVESHPWPGSAGPRVRTAAALVRPDLARSALP